MDVLLEWSDLLFLVNQAFFVLTFVVVANRTVRDRRRSDLDVALLFGVMAALLVLPRAAVALSVPVEARRVMVIPLILAVPYFMLRLVADFATVQRWALRLAELALAAQLIAFVVQGSILLAAVAAYAAVPIAWSSFAFVREARRARGVTMRRYTAAAAGNAAAVASLVVVVIAVPSGGGDIAPLASIVLQLCVLAAGTSYFIAFATPSWLRRLWRDADLRSFLAAAPALIALSDLDVLVRELAAGARAAMGSEGVLIGLSAGPGQLRFRGTGPSYDAPVDESFGGRAMRAGRALVSLDPVKDVPAQATLYRERNVKMLLAAPIRIGDEIIGALTARSSHSSLFASDDLESHPRLTRRLALRADLRRAIADGSLRLEYQPLVSLRSGGLLRLEALARWDHPQRGAIPPAEFVELAERTGLIRALTDRVLHQALTDAQEWRKWLPRLRVAINLSARMFADAALIDRITALCSLTGCDPHGLSLEITESVLMTEPERAQQLIARLHDLGVTTEIDDFGTGYSSLAYLQRLPVTGIKIDHQFIAAMSRDERSDAIVRATIRLSHELGFEVVAEGIEDRELWDLLAASGCDVGQGFYIARPMPAKAVRGWLSSWVRRALATSAPAIRPPDHRRRLVLVVDDDPAIVSVVRDVLGEHGYAVATASDGGEALAFIATTRPDAVLLDVHMPLVDGAAFVRALRDRGLDVPLIVTTAGSNAQRWAERLGATAYLAKPFAMGQRLS